jgi:UDP-2,4-diacetamido-2,4,6-trideoxy-beta-L-altropyranose hydrolase
LDKPGHLVIGAECGTQIGTGHVMRCLALAQSWKRSGGSVTFLLPKGSPAIEQRIRNEDCLLESLPPDQFGNAVVNRMLHYNPRVAVLDGYNFGSREQQTLSKAGLAVLTLDDYGHATEYPVQWVLNQNASARPEIYARRADNARLLLGPTYALLRDEFLPWLNWKRSISEKADKIFVTIGGSDPDNLSSRILESLEALGRDDLQVVLAVGSSNPHLQDLESAVRRSRVTIRIVQNAVDMPALMAWADVAISGAGGTSYELCYMGLPSLLFVIAENQRSGADQLSRLSVAVHAGAAREFDQEKFVEQFRCLINSYDLRQAMSERTRALVDGLGADRVRATLLDRGIKLRPARESDCQLLFSWATDAAARNASFHSAPILWDDHRKWFAHKIQDQQSVIYIAESGSGDPIGQVRFQLDGEQATLSVVVAPDFRRAGWGRELIALSIRKLARTHLTQRVKAFVKPENQASIRLFESAGFRRSGTDQVAGKPALLFTWDCGNETHAN